MQSDAFASVERLMPEACRRGVATLRVDDTTGRTSTAARVMPEACFQHVARLNRKRWLRFSARSSCRRRAFSTTRIDSCSCVMSKTCFQHDDDPEPLRRSG